MVGLTSPRTLFGIHSATPYNPTDRSMYGILRVLGNGAFKMSGQTIDLRGGSNKFIWGSEDGNIEASLELGMKEYPDFMIGLLLGKTPTAVAPSATGSINNFLNQKGTSIKNGSNGISGIAITSGENDDLKFGKYVIIAVSADEFDVYVASNIDFARGVDVNYENDLLKVNSAPLDVSAASAVLANFGLTFTKVGTPNFTVGDTAVFDVIPVNEAGSMSVKIGGLADIFPEFGCILLAQQKSTGEMFEIDAFRCKSLGMDLGAAEKAWSEANVVAKCRYDSARDGIAELRYVAPNSF